VVAILGQMIVVLGLGCRRLRQPKWDVESAEDPKAAT